MNPLTQTPEPYEIQPPKRSPSSTAWMMTVADLFSLMLTFFVLLYSMSDVERDKWEVITTSLSQRLQPIEQEIDFTRPDLMSIERSKFVYARNLDYLYRILAEQRHHYPQLADLSVERMPDAIRITLPEASLFTSGATQLQPEGEDTVRVLGEFLSRIGNQVEIEGHTDPRPLPAKSAYGSNWELSLARAVSVGNMFREVGYPHPLAISGLGSSRFRPADSGDQEAQRQQARRVDVLIRENVAKN